MGYYSDYQGSITATCKDVDHAMSTLEAYRRLAVYDTTSFARMFDVSCDDATLTVSVDRYEKWYDAIDDVYDLVCWLREHGCVDINGDIEVAGEDPRDLWRIHVDNGRTTRQNAVISYEEAS